MRNGRHRRGNSVTVMNTDAGQRIRALVQDDTAPALDIVLAAGLFAADDIGIVSDLLDNYFTSSTDGQLCLVSQNGSSLDGIAYAQATSAADRVWYLTMIAMRPTTQRTGADSALLRAVETELVERRQRLLLVETSALPAYEGARRFYRGAGYDEEARVRDFHEDGDDMVLFWKRLLPESANEVGPPAE